jgi:hypothetical protein
MVVVGIQYFLPNSVDRVPHHAHPRPRINLLYPSTFSTKQPIFQHGSLHAIHRPIRVFYDSLPLARLTSDIPL